MGEFTEEQMAEARGMMIKAITVLTFDAMFHPSLAARNVIFRAEELMKALDAFHSGRDDLDE
jgi:hypothetical protein